MDNREDSLSNDQPNSIGGSDNDMSEDHNSIGSEGQSEDREGTTNSPEVTASLIYEFMNFYTNETYLNGVKNEFLRLKIQYFSEDNLDFDKFDQTVFKDRIQLLEKDVYNNIEKSFEGFDVQEINFKLDRIYKWIKIIQSKNLEFFIFYNKDKIEEKDKLLRDSRFCTKVDLSEFKSTLKLASQLSTKANYPNGLIDEQQTSEVLQKNGVNDQIDSKVNTDTKVGLNEMNPGNDKLKIDIRSDKDELEAQEELSNRIEKFLHINNPEECEISENHLINQPIEQVPDALKIHTENKGPVEEETNNEETSQEKMEKQIIASLALHLRNQVEQLTAIKKIQEEANALSISELNTPTKPVTQPDDAIQSEKSIKESDDDKLPIGGDELIKKIQHSSESYSKLKGLAVESKQEFEEFFNVNLDKERVSDEYEDTFRNIVASPEFLSFAINEEYILVLRPQASVQQKKAKIFSSTRILKTKILEYLNIFDILKLRLTCKQFKDIVKSVWHVIHKKEMYNQAIYVTVNRYVC